MVTLREFPKEEILKAIEIQDRAMWDAGIMAVGDISNKVDTAACKRESPIRYVTFIEFFDFMQPHLTSKFVSQYTEVYHQFNPKKEDKISAVPHAPYTVTEKLYCGIFTNASGVSSVFIIKKQLMKMIYFSKVVEDFHPFLKTLGLIFQISPLLENLQFIMQWKI